MTTHLMFTHRAPVAVFGPPGIGKSSLVQAAVSAGWPALDFETISSHRRRLVAGQIPMSSSMLFGGADLHPRDFPWYVVPVVLTMDEQLYRLRRAKRDAARPEKAAQTTTYADFARMRSHPGVTLVHAGLSIEDTLERIEFVAYEGIARILSVMGAPK